MEEEKKVFDPAVGFEAEATPEGFKREGVREARGSGDGQKSETELLLELIAWQKKTANRQLASAIGCITLAAVMAIAMLIVVPRVISVTMELSAMAKETQELATQAQESLSGMDSMIENVNRVVVDNTQSLTDAVSNIQNIDTDGLNEAIKNLSDAAEPLAKLNNQVGNLFKNGLF